MLQKFRRRLLGRRRGRRRRRRVVLRDDVFKPIDAVDDLLDVEAGDRAKLIEQASKEHVLFRGLPHTGQWGREAGDGYQRGRGPHLDGVFRGR